VARNKTHGKGEKTKKPKRGGFKVRCYINCVAPGFRRFVRKESQGRVGKIQFTQASGNRNSFGEKKCKEKEGLKETNFITDMPMAVKDFKGKSESSQGEKNLTGPGGNTEKGRRTLRKSKGPKPW